jgi:two-component system cell cycle sensor histidine kinase/response regulator CckA
MMGRRTLRALIVEDSADDAEMLLIQLRRAGFDPVFERVESAEQMTAALASAPWDIVLSDHSLPGFDAPEALRLARASDPIVPFVVVSGVIGQESAVAMMRAGAGDYVLKEDLARLAPVVERELREAENRRERRRIEQQHARDALILANVRDAVIVTDTAGVVTDWNEGATRLFGWPAAEMVGRPLTDRVPTHQRGQIAELIRQILGGTDFAGEWQDWRKGGSRIWVDARVTRILDASGAIVGLIGVSHDISDRRRAEVRFRAMTERSFEATVLLDALGRIEYGSPAVTRIAGRPPEEWLGRDMTTWTHPDDLRGVADQFQQVIAQDGACGTAMSRFRHADGSWRWVESAFTNLLADPDVSAVVANIRDVTDRVRSEEALRRSEEELRLLADAIPEIVWVAGPDGANIYANRRWLEYTGDRPEDPLGAGWERVIHPDDRPRVALAWAKSAHSGVAYESEYRLRRHDGEYRWFLARGAASRDAQGRVARWYCTCTDIHDRREAEVALVASEERYRSLADSMPQIVWVTRPDGYHEYYNRRWYEYTGLTHEETKGEGWNHVFHPEDQKVAWEKWAKALTTGNEYQIEYRCRRHDGVYRWFLGRALPQRNAGGEIVRWFGTCTDIHDRKEADAAVRESEERYRTLVEASASIVWTSTADGGFDTDQPGWTTFTGQTVEQHRHGGWLEAIHPDDREQTARAWSEAVRNKTTYAVEHRVRRADGEYRHMTGRAIPIREKGGEIREWIGVHADVTDRVRAEEATSRLAAIVAGSDDAIIGTDMEGLATSWNAGAERLYGYAAEEVINKPYLMLVPPDKQEEAANALTQVWQGKSVPSYPTVRMHKTGRRIDVTVSVSPIRDRNGRVIGASKIAHDSTRSKMLEEQFRQAQKMEAVGRLAGGVAHDFNNLLTVINGYGEIVAGAMPPDHPSKALVQEIMKAGTRAAGLTRQLLAFSRRTVLEAKVLDPNALIHDLENMLRRLLGEDIDLATRLDPDLGRVRTDPGQLEQAIVNLCVNARDAMPRGGKLTIETHNVELDGTYVATHAGVTPGPYVALAISDNGVGMTPEILARIFEPFFTTKEVGKGTGLGLAMVFGFVKQSGGDVRVYSEPGHGTTVKVYLPRMATSELARKSEVRKSPMPRGAETVLLVEDEDAVRALGKHVLMMCGYTVLEAGRGKDAVRVAEEHDGPIHILVTDVVMPGGMGGREVAEAVSARHPKARVLYASGYMDDAIVRHGILEAGVHFLQKPFTPLALATKVREVLDGDPTGSL